MGDYVQVIAEETPRYEGAPTTAPTRLSTVVRYFPVQSFRLSPNPQFVDRSDEVRGIEGGPPQLINSYEPDGALAIRAYANDLAFLLNFCGFTPTITPGDGIITDPSGAVIPAGVSRVRYTKRTGLTAKTFQAIAAYDERGVYLRGQGYGISSLAMNADGAVTGDLVGMVLANIANPSLTPVLPAFTVPYFRRGNAELTWLAGTGVTDDFSFTITNELVRVSNFGERSFFPNSLAHGDARVRVAGSIPKYALADADLDALLAGSTFAATASWETTELIVAGGPYKLFVEMPKCQYIGGAGADELQNRRRHGGNFDWWAAWDEAAGYDVRFTVLCDLTAVETYV